MSHNENIQEIREIQEALRNTITTLELVESQCDQFVADREQFQQSLDASLDPMEALHKSKEILEFKDFRKLLGGLTGQIRLLVNLAEKIAIISARQSKMDEELTILLDLVKDLQPAEENFLARWKRMIS